VSRISVFAIALFFLVSGGNLFGQDLDDYTSVLRKLKENWYGIEAEIKSLNPAKFPSVGPVAVRIWVDSKGKVFRTNSTRQFEIKTGDTRGQDTWKYVTADMVFTRSVSWLNDRKDVSTSDSALIAGKPDPMLFESALNPVQAFFGLDRYSGVYWYEVLEDSQTSTSVSLQGRNAKVIAKNKKFGDFEFTFEKNEGLKLSSVVCDNSYVKKARSGMGVLTYKYRLNKIDYSEFGDRIFIRSIGENSGSHLDVSGKKRSWSLHQELLNKSKFGEELTDRVRFPGVSIADGVSVRVLNDKGIPYELRDGLLVRVVNEDVLLNSSKARFRKPKIYGAWWYVGLGIAIALIGGIIAYMRR
jgi:hypothetical protein